MARRINRLYALTVILALTLLSPILESIATEFRSEYWDVRRTVIQYALNRARE